MATGALIERRGVEIRCGKNQSLTDAGYEKLEEVLDEIDFVEIVQAKILERCPEMLAAVDLNDLTFTV